jgi:probable O-glycosylation ligase (exosortase A-associated)
MRAFAILFVVGIGLIVALYSRFAGFLLYAWFALFRPQEWAYGELEEFRLSLIVALAFVLPCLATGVVPNVSHRVSRAMLVLYVLVLVATIGAKDQSTAWYWANVLATTLIVCLLGVTLIDTEKRYRIALAVVAGSFGFHAAKYGVGFLIRGGARFITGIGGMFGDTNDFGLAAARIVFLLLGAAQLAPKGWLRIGLYLAVPLAAIGVISTFSRGAFLALAAGAIALVLLQRRKMIAAVLLAAVAVLALSVVPIPSEYFDRMETVRTYQAIGDRSALSRLYFWQVAVRMVADHPLGVGLRNFEANYDEYDTTLGRYGIRRSVHNTYMQALAEAGYLGLATYLVLLVSVVWTLVRVRARAAAGGLSSGQRRYCFAGANALIASATAYIVGSMFGSVLVNDLNWFTFALVIALDRTSAGFVRSSEVGVALDPHQSEQSHGC